MHFSQINSRKNTKGVTLVELMIAIVISAVLVLGIAEIFKLNKRTSQTQDDSARMQESGRFAFNMLMQDLRRAGYYGGNADTANITGSSGIITPPTNTCPTDTTWGRMLERRIIGLNESGAYTCIANYSAGSGDVVVMRYTEGADVSGGTFDANAFYIRSSMFEGRLFLGSAQANGTNAVSETPNSVHRLSANAYYVGTTGRNCRFNDATNNPIPITALYRETLGSAGTPIQEEVASSIERLQVLYGIDNDNDVAVNQYVNATNVTDWGQVVSVRFWVLARAECPTNGYTNTKTYVMGDATPYAPSDGFKRQLYSTTVTLRNGT